MTRDTHAADIHRLERLPDAELVAECRQRLAAAQGGSIPAWHDAEAIRFACLVSGRLPLYLRAQRQLIESPTGATP